jgi:hypothetical protein
MRAAAVTKPPEAAIAAKRAEMPRPISDRKKGGLPLE